MGEFIDMTGKKFNRLTVLRRDGYASGYTVKWLCLCDCGNTTSVSGSKIRSGWTQSCGCLASETRAAASLTHGRTDTPEHNTWESMIQRCTNQKNPNYPFYGGRGIAVCERWRKFENFYADMGPRPEGMTLDRVDSNGNYEKSNCRWATHAQQQSNLRNNRNILVGEKLVTIAEASRLTGIPPGTIRKRIKLGWSIRDALSNRKGSNANG